MIGCTRNSRNALAKIVSAKSSMKDRGNLGRGNRLRDRAF
jgi:hypothetical protein